MHQNCFGAAPSLFDAVSFALMQLNFLFGAARPSPSPQPGSRPPVSSPPPLGTWSPAPGRRPLAPGPQPLAPQPVGPTLAHPAPSPATKMGRPNQRPESSSIRQATTATPALTSLISSPRPSALATGPPSLVPISWSQVPAPWPLGLGTWSLVPGLATHWVHLRPS